VKKCSSSSLNGVEQGFGPGNVKMNVREHPEGRLSRLLLLQD
jgi:hypothetical protein